MALGLRMCARLWNFAKTLVLVLVLVLVRPNVSCFCSSGVSCFCSCRPSVSCSLTFCCAFVLLRRPTARFRSHRNVRAEKHVCWCFVCSRVCACVLLCCVRWCSCFLATRCRPFILWRRPTAHVVVSECARREAAEKHVCWCFVCWRVCMRFVAVFLFACVLFVFGGLCSCLLFACLCCVRCSAFII